MKPRVDGPSRTVPEPVPAEYARQSPSLGFVLRPAVPVTIPYVYGGTLWLFYRLMSAQFTRDGEPLRIISGTELTAFSVVNALLATWILWDCFRVATSGRPNRRPRLAGLLFCLLNVALFAFGTYVAHGPIPGR